MYVKISLLGLNRHNLDTVQRPKLRDMTILNQNIFCNVNEDAFKMEAHSNGAVMLMPLVLWDTKLLE